MTRLVAAVLAVLALARPAAATTGGDATLEVLGWDAARSSILVRHDLGYEGGDVDLLAFNLAARRIDFARCGGCSEASPDDPTLSAEQKTYLRLLARARRLVRLAEVPRAQWAERGIELTCASRKAKHPEFDSVFRRQRCDLGMKGRASTRFEFSAPSDWYKARVFQAPGYAQVALGWVIHTGIVEFGYRENELALAPNYPRRRLSIAEFARRYS
jgi:hypothetical protein